jgi:transposase
MNTQYVGIDMSQANFTSSYWQDRAIELGEFANNKAGFKQLARKLKTVNREQSICLVVEATGGYEQKLLHFASEQGWLFSLPNPAQLRYWARGMGYRSKTDRLDGQMLCHYGASCQPRPQLALSQPLQELGQLLARKEDLTKQKRQEQNRYHAWGQSLSPASAVGASIQRLLAFIEQELSCLQQAVDQFMLSYPEFAAEAQRLATVPGVGRETLFPLLYFCHRFRARSMGQGTAKGITAYAGLDVRLHESGRSIWSKPRISRMGDKLMRRRLYLAALGGTRSHKSPLGDFYRRLLERGKPKKVALVAAARKILVWAWAVFQSGQNFDPHYLTPSIKA